MFPIRLLVLFSLSAVCASNADICDVFKDVNCELSEDNIVGLDRHTNTPGECQEKCIQTTGCEWFEHFGTGCYLLKECGHEEQCGGCVSGPTSPEYSTCATGTTNNQDTTAFWPTTSTTTLTQTTTTSTKTTTTTTKTTTATTTTTTSTTTTTITTTKTTTTASQGDCDNIHVNEECDWDHGLVQWYENVMTGSQCQHVCMNINGAKFFSHYNEGHEAEIGVCGCFSRCNRISKDGCNANCRTSSQEISIEDFLEAETNDAELDSSETFGGELEVDNIKDPRLGTVYCHCMHGPLKPDVDTCNLWP